LGHAQVLGNQEHQSAFHGNERGNRGKSRFRGKKGPPKFGRKGSLTLAWDRNWEFSDSLSKEEWRFFRYYCGVGKHAGPSERDTPANTTGPKWWGGKDGFMVLDDRALTLLSQRKMGRLKTYHKG